MRHFGNFGMGQAGATTMVNPYFDFNGLFTAQQVRSVNGMVAYSPAPMHPKKMHHKKGGEKEERGEKFETVSERLEMGRPTGFSRKGFVGGYIGPIASVRALGR